MLKVFAGGDPAHMVEARTAWHRAKLEELRGYLALVEASEGFEGSQRTLYAGIAYEEKMLELLESVETAGGSN
jgi:hypothetical protein